MVAIKKVELDIQDPSPRLLAVWHKRKQTTRLTPKGYILHFIHRTFRAFLAQPIGTIACILLLTAALTCWGALWMVLSPIQEALLNRSLSVPIRVESAQGIDEVEAVALLAKLSAVQGISNVEYLSPEDIFIGLSQRLGSDHPLLEGVTAKDNPFSPRYLVKLKADADREQVFNSLLQLNDPLISSVKQTSLLLESLSKLINFVDSASKNLIYLALFAALIVVVVALQLRFLLRQEEFRIMSLVGATRHYIIAPLYAEAVILSFISGILAIVLLSLLEGSFQQLILESFASSQGDSITASIADFRVGLSIFSKFIILVAGLLLGILGSIITVRFFVKD